MFRKIFTFSNATLLVALILSTIAAWYSIVGLTAIFAGAVIPIIIMGSALELGKIVTTVWLRKYWKRCAWIMKLYLVPAVFFLAVLTSMGIFGFLSKAHMDQGITTGDSQAKLALYDEKIKTQRDNITAAREALQQMDAQVNNVMNKGDSERSAERSVQIRRQQQAERSRLQKDIEVANTTIAKLNEERAPIAAENRKVEAEVGPIKYIAALIYGDNPDQNILERAVRWVIILLVAVFDPLALMLVIAANQSREWDEDIDEELALKEKVEHEKVMSELKSELPVDDSLKLSDVTVSPATTDWPEPIVEEQSLLEKHPYLTKHFSHFENLTPMVQKKEDVIQEEPCVEESTKESEPPESQILAMGVDVIDRPGDYLNDIPEIVEVHVKKDPNEETGPNFEGVKVGDEWVQTGPEFKDSKIKPPKFVGDYVEYNNGLMHKDVFAAKYPDLFLKEDGGNSSKTGFGITFPTKSNVGDKFVRVDVFPNKVYKYNGIRWIETSREQSDTHLSEDYLEFLISKLATGEYDPELLTQNEQEAITEYIKSKKG